MWTDQHYMRRAYDLARLGEGSTSPNPMVGAVIVAQNRIIGEGYYKQYGGPHAEVAAVRSIKETDVHLLATSTIYITLEPCCTYGRTPPCTDLILKHKIPRVVVGTTDASPGIQGRSIALLRKAGIEVITGINEEECRHLSAQRNFYVTYNRPYIILKYAMSKDGFIGNASYQVNLSSPISWRFVHRLRQKVDAIMVGTETVVVDNPLLTNRLFWGKMPVRVVPDLHGRIPLDAHIFHSPGRTYVFRSRLLDPLAIPNEEVRVLPIDMGQPLLHQMLQLLGDEGITGLLVEGGSRLLRSFLSEGLWDEAIVCSCDTFLGEGVPNPGLVHSPEDSIAFGNDLFYWFRHERHQVTSNR